MHSKTVLNNGIRVVSVPMESVKSATVLVMVDVGSRFETPKINGISHFLEHLPAKGTKKYPSSLEISSLVDSVGASWNAFTSKEYTGFYMKTASEHMELSLDIISDELLNPLLRQEEIENERKVIFEEINMYEDQPQFRVGEVFEAMLYGSEPLAMRVLGTKESMAAITREDILSYMKSHYHGSSIVVGLAGDLQNRIDLVEKYFGQIPKGENNVFEKVTDNQSKPQVKIYSKKTDQAHLCLGVRAYNADHPDRYVLSVLSTILGGNTSSRIFREVREKRGLAYYVHTDNEEFHDCGYFMTQAGLRIADVAEAVKVILGEYSKMKERPTSLEELRRAKDYAKGKMILALEDTFKVASFYTSQELLRREIETPEEVLAKIDAVTVEDIQRVSKDIFTNEKLNLAIVGPFQEKEEFDKILSV